MSGIAIWLTGLPGSGKSTIADAIKKEYPEFIVLSMDALRKVVTPQPSYSETERDILYRALVYIAKTLTEQGNNVIIDATGNLRRWRELARELIPGYIEIYLKCSLSTCMEREKKRFNTHEAPHDIYEKGKKGWPVPGLTAPYEEPLAPELTLDTDSLSPKECLRAIKELLKKVSTFPQSADRNLHSSM
ncbi:MAG: adenylyl-sulfate kinase [Nitrospirae bacterium]|nr:adenylyl-sulfate kinase [Nitrospirota bacterium]